MRFHNVILFDNKLILSFETNLFYLSQKMAAKAKIKVTTVRRKRKQADCLPTVESKLISSSYSKI